MRCGIPLMGERVAPRCTAANSLLLVSVAGGKVTSQTRLKVAVNTLMDLMDILKQLRIDTLICGGISPDVREVLSAETVEIVDNVACTVNELLPALEGGVLRSGFGLRASGQWGFGQAAGAGSCGRGGSRQKGGGEADPKNAGPPRNATVVDCLRCSDRICLSGGNCAPEAVGAFEAASAEARRILDAAADVSLERERQLCRLAELIYFCIEMRYRTVGLAYCVDLQEPAQILSGVLGRFFDVVPVCCKVGGIFQESASGAGPGGPIACNPSGQAMLLNRAETDINVIVGLCVGTDTVFTRASEAPVTTLFVKDKSLANNPIGALYSEYYLRESLSPSHLPSEPSARMAAGEIEAFDVSCGTPHRRGSKEET